MDSPVRTLFPASNNFPNIPCRGFDPSPILALVGYYFGESDIASGTVSFEVIIQNQGNTWLDNLSLEVGYLGTDKKFRINNLAPAEIRTEKLYLQGSDIDGFLHIDSRLIIPSGTIDDMPENNLRKSTIKF